MKATELRLGNYLKPIHLAGNAEVIEIMVSGIGIQKVGDPTQKTLVLSEDIHRLEPILLSAEWLIKFGWIKKDNLYYSADGNEYFLMPLNKGFRLVEYSEAGDGEWIISNLIMYVHKFQNLIYALTDEELTLI